jgi:hypothetical protein
MVCQWIDGVVTEITIIGTTKRLIVDEVCHSPCGCRNEELILTELLSKPDLDILMISLPAPSDAVEQHQKTCATRNKIMRVGAGIMPSGASTVKTNAVRIVEVARESTRRTLRTVRPCPAV